MLARDYRDIACGGGLILIGAFATINALAYLRLGTVAQMGPGMLPSALGIILAALGVAILIPALFRASPMPQIDVRSLVTIAGSLLAFAALVQPFGLVPAVVVLTLIASRADSKLSLVETLILAASMSLLTTLIFSIGLRMQLAAFNWPW